jgi:hypothetical protein
MVGKKVIEMAMHCTKQHWPTFDKTMRGYYVRCCIYFLTIQYTMSTYKKPLAGGRVFAAITLLFCFSFLNTAYGQWCSLYQYDTAPFTGGWTDANFSICGSSLSKDFRVQVLCDPNLPGGCTGGFGPNPIRITVKLLKNGNEISSQQFNASSVSALVYFNGTSATSGSYSSTAQIERRTITGYTTLATYTSNAIVASQTTAQPEFNINGTPVANLGNAGTICASNVTLNAAATSCETQYWIAVEESDQWFNRTFDYEWGKWFSGTAPNGINLQQYCTAYSYPPYYTGNSARQGSPMIGGNLPSGTARYYRITLATQDPTWVSKTIILKIDGNCKTGTVIDDKGDATEVALDADVRTLFGPAAVSIDVFPNPATEAVSLRIHHAQAETCTIALFDLKGTQLLQSELALGDGAENGMQLQRPQGLAPGMYLLQVRVQDKTYNKRIVWQ